MYISEYDVCSVMVPCHTSLSPQLRRCNGRTAGPFVLFIYIYIYERWGSPVLNLINFSNPFITPPVQYSRCTPPCIALIHKIFIPPASNQFPFCIQERGLLAPSPLELLGFWQYKNMIESISSTGSSPTTPLLCDPTTTTASSSSSDSDDGRPSSCRSILRGGGGGGGGGEEGIRFTIRPVSSCGRGSYRCLAVLSGHVGSVSSLALCGEFILSASQGRDIIVWQQPDLRQFTRFGQGDGSVKALIAVGSKVFTAHQDSKIRVWKVSRGSENAFRLADTLPTTKDYLGKFMSQRNYVQTRRHHRRLWIEHADSISCLAVSGGLIYSGSWDKTLKIWRLSDLRCLESIKAHDDAINALASSGSDGVVFSASADGKIKAWGRDGGGGGKGSHSLRGVLEGNKDVSLNSMAIMDHGRTVYAGGSDGYLIGWRRGSDSGEWKKVCGRRAHEMAVLCVCSVGEFLCCGSADGSVSVWKTESGSGRIQKFEVVRGHGGPVKCVQAMSHAGGVGGFLLYSGSLDKSLRVWWVPKEDSSAMEDGQENSLKIKIK